MLNLPSLFTACGLACTLAATSHGQTHEPFDEAYQVPVSQEAVFHVAGSAIGGDMEGNAFLREVVYPDSSSYTRFYTPTSVSGLVIEANRGEVFSLRGGTNITSGLPGLHPVGGFSTGTPRPGISANDLSEFSRALQRAFASRNLNHYLDLNESVNFMFTLNFERPVRDDDPTASDVRGELLYFERGNGGGNSWLTFQAVDGAGVALGPPVAISPEETFVTTPEFAVLAENQRFGGVTLDVSRLGVDEVQHLLVRRTLTCDAGYTPLADMTVDGNPDFKVFAVMTHPEDLASSGLAYD